MSAQIPSTMRMKDLLKPSGYDCPEELLDKTFEEATSGGEVSTNTDATIDVSQYTEPVEITPAEGYDATKKVTLTLENIPAGADLESNHAATIDVSTYTEPVEIEPTAGKDGMEKVTVTLDNIPSGGTITACAWQSLLDEYSYTVYTLNSTPSVGDQVLYSGGNSGVGRDGIHTSTVATVENTAITVSAEDFIDMTFSRYSQGDIQLT